MGKKWYLDASALAKRYATEVGSPVVNYLFSQVAPGHMMCLTLGTLEVISIFVRKKNAGQLSPEAFNQVMADFRGEFLDSTAVSKINATDSLVESAIPLVVKHLLNATDGVILQSALDIRAQMQSSGGDTLVLFACDQRLVRAAQLEGLLTFNHETQAQAVLDALLTTP